MHLSLFGAWAPPSNDSDEEFLIPVAVRILRLISNLSSVESVAMIRLKLYRDRIEATPAVETIRSAALRLRGEIVARMKFFFTGMLGATSVAVAATFLFDLAVAPLIFLLAMTFLALAIQTTRRILARMRVEEAKVLEKVAERELLYFDLYDDAPDMMLSVDAATWKVIQCNRTLLRVTGFEESEVIGKPIFEFYHPDSVSRVADLADQYLKTGRLQDEELRILRKDGSTLDVSLSSTAVRNHDGQVVYSRSSWRDISKRKAAEAAARAGDLRFRAFVEAIPHIVWSADKNGELEFVNRRWLDYTGIAAASDPSNEVIHPEDRERMHSAWRESLRENCAFECEIRIRSVRTGQYRWFLSRAVPVKLGEADATRWIGTSVDIEDLRNAKEIEAAALIRERSAEESSRMKSEFLAMVSHEIRTPLNTVVGMSDLLLREPLSEMQQECANSIKESGAVLISLINDIIDLSRIESGRLEIDDVDFEPKRLLDSIEAETVHALSGKLVKVEFKGLETLPKVAKGDPLRIRQILTNLLSNAMKFTHRGRIELRVASADVDGEPTWHFEVEDTGIGIDATKISRLFKPFTQGDSSTTRIYGGTGLGLSICKRLVELMGGTIFVSSEPGRGSTFSFTIVVQQGAETLTGSPVIRTPGSRIVGSRILVVDDAATNRRVLELFLMRLGHEVTAVDSGRAALETLEKFRFDLVLMDCHMPEMDGYETTLQIRARAEDSESQVPIIALTASTLKGERERCLSVGMSDYLSKPIQLAELDQTLQNWLRNSVIDWTVFDGLKSLDAAGFTNSGRELLTIYERTGREKLEAIISAIREASANEIARRAHALKSSSAFLGAYRVQRVCDEIGELGAAGDWLSAEMKVERLEAEYSEALKHLREEFG